jgi:hypothetical protein
LHGIGAVIVVLPETVRRFGPRDSASALVRRMALRPVRWLPNGVIGTSMHHSSRAVTAPDHLPAWVRLALPS